MASAPRVISQPDSVVSGLGRVLREAITQAGGWLAFDRFMALALYQPGLGYYANQGRLFGAMPQSGSDFVTAPELSPLFGRALAHQVAQVLKATDATEVLEFGAGSGALAEQLLDALDAQGVAVSRYAIVDLSGSLRQRQQQRLARLAPRVVWLDALPEAVHGVVIGNEVLDAMPVQLLHFDGQQWLERGVVLADQAPGKATATAPHHAGHHVGHQPGHQTGHTGAEPAPRLAWQDRPTPLRPPLDAPFVPGTVTEVHPQAQAFIRTLAGVLQRGVALFIDYGFPEAEYYHPQRTGGTLMCHQAHRADADPLVDVGRKDITAHVDFTGIALAAQDAGLDVLGYTSQARFLFNCGLIGLLETASLAERAMAQKLVTEHEMGELFKVIALGRGAPDELLGFAAGDRSHRL